MASCQLGGQGHGGVEVGAAGHAPGEVALRQELAQLPAPHGEELLARLAPTAEWPSIETLTTAGADGCLHALLELVEALAAAGIGLSESIGSRYFSHAAPGFHMVRG